MRRVAAVWLAVMTALSGCAGSTSDDGGVPSDTGPADTGPVDSGVVDTAPPDPPPPDTGPPPPMCEDDDYADTCELATDLGALEIGDTLSPPPGSLPNDGDEDWYRIDFPADPEMNTPGGGTPTIEITVNEGDSFRFEVLSTCDSEPLVCDVDGMMAAQDVEQWSFVDDQSIEGPEQWTTRDVPWPDSVLLRVYRPDGPGDCQRYRLGISR